LSDYVDIDPYNLELLRDVAKHEGFQLYRKRLEETLKGKREDLENGNGGTKHLRGEIAAYKVALDLIEVLIREQVEGLKEKEQEEIGRASCRERV